MALESGVLPEDSRSAETVHCTKVKGRGLNLRIIEELDYKHGWENICRKISGQSVA